MRIDYSLASYLIWQVEAEAAPLSRLARTICLAPACITAWSSPSTKVGPHNNQSAAFFAHLKDLRYGAVIPFDRRLIDDEDQLLIGPVALGSVDYLLQTPTIEWLVIVRTSANQRPSA
jgi:hypothetical protein